MDNCEWEIPCTREKQKGSIFCDNHSRAMGIRPEKGAKATAAKKLTLTEFFNQQLCIMPRGCMECNDPLYKSQVINPRTPVAHLLSKSQFKSVETNPLNIIFLCQRHHDSYDQQREKFMKNSALSSLIRERIALLFPLLTQQERAKIPEYLF